MKRTKYEGGETNRLVITGMIVNRHVLATIADKWKEPGLFPEPWCNIVGQWCVDYYEKYQKAPKKAIETLFEKWSKKHRDKDTVSIIESFLGKLSKQYETQRKAYHSEYILDQAKDLFTNAGLIELEEDIQQCRMAGDYKKAKELVAKFTPIEMGTNAGVDLFSKSGKEIVRHSFEEQREPLFVYKGAMGNFIGEHFCRGNFISLMAPEKRGKTWFLLEFGMKPALQGCKVAFFECGDMSQAQITRRFMTRLAKRPMKAGEYKIPTGLMPGEPPEVQNKIKTYKEDLDWNEAWEGVRKIMDKGKGGNFRLYTYPNDTISAAGIRAVLQKEKRNGFIPDVVLVDYADILASPPGFMGDSRDAINGTWKTLRSINLEMDNLLITATQSDALSYDAKTLGKKHFSNDKRKFAHVTGMLGLNQTEDEKIAGLMRLNWIVLREGEFSESKTVTVATSFATARPIMFSTFT